MLVQLAVLLDVLAHQIQHDRRDQQLAAGDGALLSAQLAHAHEEILHVLARKERIALLHVHAEKFSGVHDLIVLPLFPVRGLCGLGAAIVQFVQLALELVDLLLQPARGLCVVILLLGQRGVVGLPLGGLLVERVLRLVGRVRIDLADGLLQLLFAELHRRPALHQLIMGLLGLCHLRAKSLDLLAQQNLFKHAFSSSSCISRGMPPPVFL